VKVIFTDIAVPYVVGRIIVKLMQLVAGASLIIAEVVANGILWLWGGIESIIALVNCQSRNPSDGMSPQLAPVQ